MRQYFRYEAETGKVMWAKTCGHKTAGSEAGWVRKDGRWKIGFRRRMYYRTAIAFLCMLGRLPLKGMHIDHLNGNKNDDRWENLEEVTPRENSCRGPQCRNSVIPGVTRMKTGYYKANFRVVGVNYQNCFKHVEDAVACRRAWERQYA